MRFLPSFPNWVKSLRPSWHGQWMRDSALLLLSQLAVLAMTSLLAILVARTLGPEEFGTFSVGLGLAQALSTIADLGMTTWLLRGLSATFASEQTRSEMLDEAGRRVGAVLGITGLLSFFLASGTSVAAYSMGLSLDLGVALFAVMGYTGFVAISFQFEAVMRAKRELRLVIVATMGEKALVLGLVAVALALDMGILGLAVAYIAGGLSRAAFGFFVVRLRLHVRPRYPSLRRARTVATAVLPFQIQGLALNVLPQLDVVLVGAVSVTAAGYFAVGARIAGAFLFIPATAASTLYPWLARESRPVRASARVSALLGLAGLVIAMAGVVAASTFVPAIFGEAYDPAVSTVQILLAILPVTFVCNGLIAGLYSDGQERRVLAVTGPSMVIGTMAIVAGAALIGPEGAAAGCVLRGMLLLAFLTRLTRQRIHAEVLVQRRPTSTEHRQAPVQPPAV